MTTMTVAMAEWFYTRALRVLPALVSLLTTQLRTPLLQRPCPPARILACDTALKPKDETSYTEYILNTSNAISCRYKQVHL